MAWLLAICVVAAPLSQGQLPTGQTQGKAEVRPAFETASVKLRPANNGAPSISPYGTGRFTATNAALELLLEIAFGVEQNQISGAPDWIYSERYDVNARPESGVILTYEQVKPRLQRLLERRLKLATHRATKEFEGYRLVVANGGPKLRKTAGASAPGAVYVTGLKFRNISMAAFAPVLATPTGRPVVDKTGIKGNYDIELNYAQGGVANASLPSIFAALQDQLGLRLEPQKLPIEMLVIDHVEKVPSEN